MGYLSVSILLLGFILGYFSPRIVGWTILILFLLLYPANFAIVPSDVLYLNINRLAFAVTLGIHVQYREKFKVKLIFKNNFFKAFLLFSALVVVYSLKDRSLNIIVSYFPNIYLVIALPFLIVRKLNDFYILINVFVWQAVFFGGVILLHYFANIDLTTFARRFIPENEGYQAIIAIRGDLTRISGFDGNSVQSAYRLSFLLPISIWYLFEEKRMVFRVIPFVVCVAGMLLLMTRAAYAGAIFAFFYLLLFLWKQSKSVFSKVLRLSSIIVSSIVLIAVLFFLVPSLQIFSIKNVEFLKSSQSQEQIKYKADRIPVAIEKGLEKPFLGHGSPQYAYYVVMETDDVPSPFIYFISGGILLLILFLTWVYLMPAYMIKLSKSIFFESKDKTIFLYFGAAFVGGLVPLFANMQERHVLAMLILFSGSYKYYIISASNYIKSHKKKILANNK